MAKLFAAICQTSGGIIVPLPTINRHIRERGFDHTLKLAQCLGRLWGLRVETILRRGNDCVQVGASAEARVEQAKTAYILRENVDRDANYILLDDVWTTGSSLCSACEVLRAGGCEKIDIAVLAKSG